MPDSLQVQPTVEGKCLCQSIKYKVHGTMRDVILCHCEKCRKSHGHVSAHASTKRENLEISGEENLQWYKSPTDETPNVHRGFCKICGSRLFWDPRDNDFIYISAGTIDSPTNLDTVGHVWISQAGDYYEITDNLPSYPESSKGALVGKK